ncbi:hypothetical protein Rhopal_007227-T1 [Rhodotorula paludigena]|uniref:Uncharacterized protein n=1 Tax=Rhodotorula paludigena TaxID=86838 RepID=A0AAV5GV62_9BASI|nr:hypothetical protein Rhopal_007227-T1 [Rhodotorula paludigena]
MPSSSSSSKASWDEMVDLAIHSGKGEKISRTKIYAFINLAGLWLDRKTTLTPLRGVAQDEFHVDVTENEASKQSFKDTVEQRIRDGYVKQDKQSFLFTKKGKEYYDKSYEE